MCFRISKRYQEGAKKIVQNSSRDSPLPEKRETLSTSKSVRKQVTAMNQQQKQMQIEVVKATIDIPHINFTIVDDCADADVPLISFDLMCLTLEYKDSEDAIYRNIDIGMRVEMNYYNRSISAYEPIIEDYEPRMIVNLLKKRASKSSQYKDATETKIKIEPRANSSGNLQLTFTSAFLTLLKLTTNTWTRNLENDMLVKQRNKFIPYILRNETGQDLFYTIESMGDVSNVDGSNKVGRRNGQNIFIRPSLAGEILLSAGEEKQLTMLNGKEKKGNNILDNVTSRSLDSASISRNAKARSNEMVLDQIRFRLNKYYPSETVTISRIGCCYRYAFIQEIEDLEDMSAVLRFVVDISNYGTAQKLIVIRSGLVIESHIDRPLCLYAKTDLDAVDNFWADGQITNNKTHPVSIHSTSHLLGIIPEDWRNNFKLTSSMLNWEKEEKKVQQMISEKRENSKTATAMFKGSNYYMVSQRRPLEVTAKHKTASDFWIRAVIEPENYGSTDKMIDELSRKRNEYYPEIFEKTFVKHLKKIPGHKIKLHPPLTVKNNLPIDLCVILRGKGVVDDSRETTHAQQREYIPVQQHILQSNSSKQIHNLVKRICISDPKAISLSLKIPDYNFPKESDIKVILPTTHEFQSSKKYHLYTREIMLYDRMSRPLVLKAEISIIDNAAIHVAIYCPVLIINDTGLPLIFSQVSEKRQNRVAAGQFDEHEVGRMITPLLFSFPDMESQSNSSSSSRASEATFRLGHLGAKTYPAWTAREMSFDADSNFWRVANSSDKSYEFGISVITVDKTKIVTFRPKYVLFNNTDYTLHFAKQQDVFGLFATDPRNQSEYVKIVSKSSSIYHWNDEGKSEDRQSAKLCLRVNDKKISTRWSGAFTIDCQESNNVNVREELGQLFSLFHIQVKTINAVYYTTITQYDKNTPPPYKICNYSQVPLMLRHEAVADDSLMMCIEPNEKVHYCLDEPT